VLIEDEKCGINLFAQADPKVTSEGSLKTRTHAYIIRRINLRSKYLGLVMIAVVLLFIVAIYFSLDYMNCVVIAKGFGVNYKYNPFEGCLLEQGKNVWVFPYLFYNK
jgi:hypothetical protein